MLGINEMNQELVRAFNINLCYNDIAITNLTVQNLDGKDHIVISFDKNMDSKQCMKYLNNMKEKIIKRSYRDEKAAGVSYNLKFFPFAFNTKHLPRDNKGRKKFSVEMDKGVVFNLKCYLAKALAGDVKEGMGKKHGPEYLREHICNASFDKNSYLYCMLFHDEGLQKDFVDLFSAKIRRYENAPSDYLEIVGNCVYIKKSIFDNIEFIKDIEAHNASLICRDFQTPSSKDKGVEDLKFPIISFIRKTGIPVHSVIRTSYEGSNEDSVLIPIVAQNGKVNRLLNDNDAYRISSAFDMEILSNVSESISTRLPKSGSFDGVVYGIDFSDLDISHCVITKIMESSVINKDHELAIDPELHFRALSPVQSQVPNGPSSSLTGTSTQGFPTRSHGKELEGSPRQGLLSVVPLNPLDIPGTSREFLPSTCMSSTAVSQHAQLEKCVGAAQNVPAGTSAWTQPIGAWSSPAPSAGPSLWQPSRPSSWKGANGSGSAWTSQPIDSWSSSAPSESMRTGKSIWYVPSSYSPGVEDVNDVEHEKQQVSGECSEAKSQESESTKKHGGGLFCKERWSAALSSPFKRRSVERDTMCSSKSDLVHPVTEKPPVSKSFFSFPTRKKAKSNPPSGVNSPTHEGAPGGLKPLTSDERKELRPFLSPELQKKLDSNSFSPGEEQHLYLTHTLSGKRELSRSLCEGKESQLLRLTKAQLPDNSSSKRDSGYSSGLPAFPAMPHKGSVSSELKHPQQVKHMSEALGK